MTFRQQEKTSEIMTTFRANSTFPRALALDCSNVSPSFFSNTTNSIQVSTLNRLNYTPLSRTHSSCGITKVDLEAPHGSDDGDDGLDSVAVDHSLVLLTFLFWVACLVDDPAEKAEKYVQQMRHLPATNKSKRFQMLPSDTENSFFMTNSPRWIVSLLFQRSLEFT